MPPLVAPPTEEKKRKALQPMASDSKEATSTDAPSRTRPTNRRRVTMKPRTVPQLIKDRGIVVTKSQQREIGRIVCALYTEKFGAAPQKVGASTSNGYAPEHWEFVYTSINECMGSPQ